MPSQKKFILFASHTSAITGPTQSLLALLPYLRSEYDLAVLDPEDGPLSRRLEQMGIREFRVSERRGWMAVAKMADLIHRENPDLIYGNNSSTYTRNALLASRWVRRPYIWHVRGVKWHWDWSKGSFLRLASRIIAVSKACVEPLARFIAPEKVRVIYNGVDAAVFQQDPVQARRYLMDLVGLPEGARILVNTGHLRPGKGQAELIDIMHRLHRLAPERPNLHLVLIGSLTSDTAYTAEVRRQIAQYQLDGFVHLLGLRDDVPRLLAGADVYVHTSRQEAHPRSIIEAMAAGRPVAAFAVGGVRETVIDGQTGYLVEYGDCPGMSRVVEQLLASPQLAAAFGEQGQQRVDQHFTAAGTAAQINQVLHELLDGKRK